MIKPFYRMTHGVSLSCNGAGFDLNSIICGMIGLVPDDDSNLAVSPDGNSAIQYAPRSIVLRANDSYDSKSPLYVPQNVDEAADLYGGKTTDLRYELLKGGGALTGLETQEGGTGYKRFEYLFTGNPDNRIPPMADVADYGKLGAAYLRSVSASAIMSVVLTYLGADVTIDDGHDLYEMSLGKNDKAVFNWTPRTFFLVDPDDTEIQFQLSSRKLAVQVLAASTFEGERLNILSRNALVPKFDSLIPLGTYDKSAVSSTEIRVVKGTRLFKNDKGTFIDVDMKTSLEDLGFKKKAIKELVSALTPAASSTTSKIKRVATLQPVVDNEIKAVEAKLPVDPIRDVFGAYFAVSPHQLDRSRVIFGNSMAEVMDEAKSLVKRMTSPVTITTFTTTNADPNYKSGVIVKNTNLMAGKYKATKQLVPTASANLRADQYLEPKDNPPALQTPAVDQNVVEVTNVIKELIGRGYFTRDVSVMNPGGTTADIQLSFPTPSAHYRDEVVGTARRIDAWLRKQGIRVEKFKLQYAKTYAIVHIALPKLKDNDYKSCLMLAKSPPMLGTPIYSVKGKEQITVSATSYNIHTGKVLVTPIRSSTLYKRPFEVAYDQLFQI